MRLFRTAKSNSKAKVVKAWIGFKIEGFWLLFVDAAFLPTKFCCLGYRSISVQKWTPGSGGGRGGILSAKQMRWLAKFAAENQCRLILCGDSRQHHAIERGDSLRVLEKTSAIRPAGLTKIFRQRIPALRDAIQELSRGETEKGFDKLDEFGVIQEIEDEATRLAGIAELQVTAIKEKKSSLIVAPTHGECRQIAKAMRQAMKSEGLLSDTEQTFSRLDRLNLTAGQRQDSINYELGNVIEFHRRAAGGFKSGEQWQVVERAGASELVVENGGRRKALALSQAGKFSVFKAEAISLSVGD